MRAHFFCVLLRRRWYLHLPRKAHARSHLRFCAVGAAMQQHMLLLNDLKQPPR
jgi:hypothetical protein